MKKLQERKTHQSTIQNVINIYLKNYKILMTELDEIIKTYYKSAKKLTTKYLLLNTNY